LDYTASGNMLSDTEQRKTTGEKKTFKLVTLVLAMFIKWAKLVKALKLLKLLQVSKIFLTFFTMALSILVYSFSFGPWFSVGFVLMLFVHEMGHVLALRQKGYKASAPIFIPMLGAMIFAPKFNNDEEEAYIGFGGPLIGGLGAAAIIALWAILPQKYEILLLIGYTAAFVNLFNMLPIRPLDGGRITRIVGGWFQWLGFIGLIGLTIMVKEPSVLLVWILVISDLNIKPSMSFWMVLLCWVGMTGLMVAGYGDQSWWWDLTDILIAGFFVLVCREAVINAEKNKEKETEKTPAPIKIRLKWFALYTVLLISLIGLMTAVTPYLPQVISK